MGSRWGLEIGSSTAICLEVALTDVFYDKGEAGGLKNVLKGEKCSTRL